VQDAQGPACKFEFHIVTKRPDLCTLNHTIHGGALMAFADSVGAAATVINLPDDARGTTTIAPTLAPVSAIATARPWYFSNHGAIVALRPITDIVA